MLISHMLNENPFAAAFMDWKVQMRLYRVSISATTLVEWSCTFKTDPHVRPIPAQVPPLSVSMCKLGLPLLVAPDRYGFLDQDVHAPARAACGGTQCACSGAARGPVCSGRSRVGLLLGTASGSCAQSLSLNCCLWAALAWSSRTQCAWSVPWACLGRGMQAWN